jgi:hypothetical protein
MQTVSEASWEQAVRMGDGASQETLALIEGAKMQITRALTELCAGDLEPYSPGHRSGDETDAALMLVGEPPCSILDIGLGGTGDEPVITMELLPVGDAPMTAEMVERWGPGEQGSRPRRVEWTFRWDAGPERTIVYDIQHNGNAANYASDGRRRTALMLAGLAGWPLP